MWPQYSPLIPNVLSLELYTKVGHVPPWLNRVKVCVTREIPMVTVTLNPCSLLGPTDSGSLLLYPWSYAPPRAPGAHPADSPASAPPLEVLAAQIQPQVLDMSESYLATFKPGLDVSSHSAQVLNLSGPPALAQPWSGLL